MAESSETGRIEAFSDGVFAIAMTLLVLDLHVPNLKEAAAQHGLGPALVHEWPMYLAYVSSFLTILVMWVNHHSLFRHIQRTSGALLFSNGLLLMAVTIVPFPTALVAQYALQPESRLAAMIYAGTFVVIAVSYNAVWHVAAKERRLLGEDVDDSSIDAITRNYRFGPPMYVLAVLLAFVNVHLSLGLVAALALFYMVAGSDIRPSGANS